MQTAFLKSYYYSKEKSNSTKPFVFGSETGIGVCLTCIPLLLFLQKPQGGKLIQHTFLLLFSYNNHETELGCEGVSDPKPPCWLSELTCLI